MAIVIERHRGLIRQSEEQFGLECPYCGVYSHMTPQSIPDCDKIHKEQPKHVGLVYQCDACRASVFLRFAVKQYSDSAVELYRNFIELERPKERFFVFLFYQSTQRLYFGRRCRATRTITSTAFCVNVPSRGEQRFRRHGRKRGKLRAFDEVIVAQEIAKIGDDSFEPIKPGVIRKWRRRQHAVTEPCAGRDPARSAERHVLPVLCPPRKTDARNQGKTILRLGRQRYPAAERVGPANLRIFGRPDLIHWRQVFRIIRLVGFLTHVRFLSLIGSTASALRAIPAP